MMTEYKKIISWPDNSQWVVNWRIW